MAVAFVRLRSAKAAGLGIWSRIRVAVSVVGAGELRARGRAAEVFDEMRGNLFEETRGNGWLGHVAAVTATIAGACHHERVHGACHADVAEAALLFEAGGIGEGARVGKKALLHAGEEDERKLEALGGVQGHQRDLGFGAVAVGVADERGVIEELVQGFSALLRVLRGVGEFLQVLDAGEGLGRGFFFERADVAAAVVEKLDEFGERGGVAGFAEGWASRCPS